MVLAEVLKAVGVEVVARLEFLAEVVVFVGYSDRCRGSHAGMAKIMKIKMFTLRI